MTWLTVVACYLFAAVVWGLWFGRVLESRHREQTRRVA